MPFDPLTRTASDRGPDPAPTAAAGFSSPPRLEMVEASRGTVENSLSFGSYALPDSELLDLAPLDRRPPADPAVLQAVQARIITALADLGTRTSAGDITYGHTLVRYELFLAPGVRSTTFEGLEADLARLMCQGQLRLRGLLPGKASVAVDIPQTERLGITLRELLESQEWEETKAKIPLALGKDVYGKTIIADLAAMPHCLVAGATGSGKSVCINSIVASLLYKFTPEQLRLVMVDPKVVELQVYNELPHLVVPVVTDPKKVLLALRWVIDEMMKRYELFARTGVRNITGFNARPMVGANEAAVAAPPTLARVVVIISDLDSLLPWAEPEVESSLERMAGRGADVGIHLVVSSRLAHLGARRTELASHLDGRICLTLPTADESLTVLKELGAESLLAAGDLLLRPRPGVASTRLQGVHVSPAEILRLVRHAAAQGAPTFESSIHEQLQNAGKEEGDVTDEDEELVEKCLEIMRQEKKASTSMLQRRLRLGYTRAARIVDIMEARGIVGPENGARGREILVDLDFPPSGSHPSPAPVPSPRLVCPHPGPSSGGPEGVSEAPSSAPVPRIPHPAARLWTVTLVLAGAALALRAGWAVALVVLSRSPNVADLTAAVLYGVPAIPLLAWGCRRRGGR